MLLISNPGDAAGIEASIYTEKLEYDLPEQPLNQTLHQFSLKSGFQIFYDFELASSHRAPAIVGHFNIQEVLTRLLQGSGLMAVLVAPGTISIRKAPLAGHMQRYVEALPARILSALCHTDGLNLGAYRLALQLSVRADGQVAMLKLLGSSGDEARDSLLLQALGRLRLEPPPAFLPQPVTLVIEKPARGSCLALD
jgi:hypothetical protein